MWRLVTLGDSLTAEKKVLSNWCDCDEYLPFFLSYLFSTQKLLYVSPTSLSLSVSCGPVVIAHVVGGRLHALYKQAESSLSCAQFICCSCPAASEMR